MMNWAMWSTLTLMDFCRPEDTRISGEPPGVAFTPGQNAGPERMLGPMRLTPVTRMSFLQFSAMKMAHAPPGHHSVTGRPSQGGLNYTEYVIYRGEQVRIGLHVLHFID